MKKQFLSWGLILSLLLTMLPVPAMAAEQPEPETPPAQTADTLSPDSVNTLTGTGTETETSSCGGTHTGWTELTSLGGTLSGGNYFLDADGDVTVSSNITIESNVTLCLNGRTLDLSGYHFIVNSGGSLTICDCSDTGNGGNGKITGGEATYGGAVLVNNGGSLTLHSGTITGNTATVNDGGGGSGGGVRVNGGTFTMHGGAITSNVATLNGGGVCMDDGTFTMYGGAITDNKAVDGGGVRVDGGTFTMSGGSITSNETTAGGGGGVQLLSGNFTMSGGSITNNTAPTSANGGGVLVSGSDSTFTMSGDASITGNTAGSGGGVLVNSSGTFTMKGGSITTNTAANNGGGVNSSGTFNMSDNAQITGNAASSSGGGVYSTGTFNMSGSAQITGNTSTTNTFIYGGGGVYVSGGTFTLSGAPKITGNTKNNAANNVYLNSNTVIAIGGQLTGSSNIGVTMKTPGVFTSGWRAHMSNNAPADYFISEKSGYQVARNSDGEAMLHQHSYTYTAEDDTITQSCADCGHEATATLSAPNLTYDGQPKTAIITYGGDAWVGGELTITYQKDEAQLGAAPTDAGTYTATIQKDSAIARITFAIAQKEYNASDFTINPILKQDYTGSEIEPDVTITVDDKTLEKGTDYTLTYKDNTSKGTATVTITFQGNYSGTVDKTFEIDYAGLPGDKTLADYVTVPAPNANGWYKEDITLTPANGVSIGTTDAATGGITVTTEGTHTQEVFIRDSDDKIYKTEITCKLDKTPPVVDEPQAADGDGWTKDDVPVSFTASDSPSGIDSVTVTKPDGTTETLTGSGDDYSFTADSNGTYTVTVTDKAGNESTQTIIIDKIDKTEPTVSISGGDTSDTNLTLTVEASDGDQSGIADITVSGPGNPTVTVDNTFIVTESGTYTITVTDNVGNQAQETITVHSITIDGTVQLVKDGDKAQQPANPTKPGYTFDGWMNGQNQWDFDDPVKSNLTLTAKWTLNAPTVTLTASKTSVTYGEPITLTAETDYVPGDGVTVSYAWYHGSEPLSTNGATLTRTDVAHSGEYRVVVTATDADGQHTNDEDSLTVSIASKTITATWSGLTQVYGTEEPVKATLSGIVDGDDVSVQVDGDEQTAAGTYDLEATLTGDDAPNYTLKNSEATLTIQKKPVVITVTGSVTTTDNVILPTITAPDLSTNDYEILYKDEDGKEVPNPTAPGSYEVWVKFPDDSNCRHPDGSLEAPVGSFTIAETLPTLYTVTFADGEGVTDDTASLEAVGGTILTLPTCGFTKDNARFTGWSYGGKTYQPGDRFTMPDQTVTFTAQWQQTYGITVNVTEKTDGGTTPTVANAVVSLWLGANKLDEKTTDGDGKYTFTDLLPGIYNLVVTKDERTVTSKVELTTTDETCDATLPKGATNSIVQVTEGSPDIVVGNLDTVFQQETDETVYTKADQDTVRDGGKVEITFTADEKQQDDASINSDMTMIAEEADDAVTVGLVMDYKITKSVTDNQTTTMTNITQSNVLLEILLPLPAQLQGKASYSIYRVHEDAVQELTATPNTLGEYFTVNSDRTGLTLYVKCFSTYAIGYTESSENNNNNNNNQTSSGGSSSPTYAPTVVQPEHGTVTVSPKNPQKGSTVTITATPDDGYAADTVTVTDAKGQAVTVTPKGDGTYTFVQPTGKVTITVTFRQIPEASSCPRDESCPMAAFTDADRSAWYHDGVHYCVAHGLMVGTSKTTFAPNIPITRGMIVTILWRLEGSPMVDAPLDYSDVRPSDWYGEAVRWADSAGVVTGYGNGKFGPNDPITREQMAAMLWRYVESPAAEGALSAFVDGAQTSGWAQPAVLWAVDQGLLTGVGNDRLAPLGQATRAQAATILMRFAESVAR